MNEITKPTGIVRLYACGGGGINIGLLLERYRDSNSAGFAGLDITYVDTSLSNINKTVPGASCYLLPNMDGSGKVRSENSEAISGHAKAILQKHQPGDLSIVLSTFAGGSGSVIGPYLTSELLAMEQSVIVCGVGSASSKLEAENTLKTIKSYEGIAQRRNAPVIVSYVQNGQGVSRGQADSTMIVTITSLMALFSRQNRELDSRDLFNWLNYNRVTSFQPKVTGLHLLTNDNVIDDSVGNVITVASLVKDGEEAPLYGFVPEYATVGYLADNADKTLLQSAPISFVTGDNIMPSAAGSLTALLRDLEKKQNARVQGASILGSNDKADGSGVVL